MRISDWSSDVCSSDLAAGVVAVAQRRVVTIAFGRLPVAGDRRVFLLPRRRLLAFASCGLLRLPGFRRLGRQARFALLASSEERRVGKECVRTWSSRCSPYHYTHKTKRTPTHRK